MVVEGTLHLPFSPLEMVGYCIDITKVLGMTPVSSPICNHDPDYGWCAYMHWKESGMHVYGWDNRRPPFFSIDIYWADLDDRFGQGLGGEMDLDWRFGLL